MNAYKQHFDELGQPIDQTPPWHAADLLVIALALFCIAGILMGIFR